MKKNLKRGLVLALILLQLLTLCGCNQLDQMRQQQVFCDENGDIGWKGSSYRKLPDCDYFQPELDYDTMLWVTDPDVPVLLSPFMAQYWIYPSSDGSVLYDTYESAYFCREEMYEDICSRMQSFEPELVCYCYDVYDEQTNEYKTEYYTLTQDQLAAIELVTQTVEPMVMGDGWYLDYEWCIWLEECSQDMLFRRNNLDIAVSANSYYLLLYTDTQTLAFAVPEGCRATFDEIVSAYENAYWQYGEDFLELDI